MEMVNIGMGRLNIIQNSIFIFSYSKKITKSKCDKL